jgi:UDP-N-acetylglucosamine 3-dehydrogenase
MGNLKIAIVGCGLVAQKRHIPSFLRLRKSVSVRAVCDLNQNLEREVARKFGVHHSYSSLSEMLAKEDLDIVDICTPPQTHANLAIESMENGCHVILEKPMALNVADCDKMIRVSQKYGLKLSVVHNQIFYPPFLEARKIVAGGAIGKLTGMRIFSSTSRSEFLAHEDHWVHRLPGGVLGETGPHAIYMSLAFLEKVRSADVHAKKISEFPWVLYDEYRVILSGDNLSSSIVISHANDFTADSVDLFGTEGMISLDLQSMLLTLYKRRNLRSRSLALSSLGVAGQIVKGIASNVFSVMRGETFLGHNIVIEKFVDSIINDEAVPVSVDEGRETVRVMEILVRRLLSLRTTSKLFLRAD